MLDSRRLSKPQAGFSSARSLEEEGLLPPREEGRFVALKAKKETLSSEDLAAGSGITSLKLHKKKKKKRTRKRERERERVEERSIVERPLRV